MGVFDGNGIGITFDFDVANNTETVTDAQGNTNVLLYDDRGNVLEDTNILGDKIVRTYDTSGNELTFMAPGGGKFTRTFDTNGNITSVENPFGKTQIYNYDTSNNLLTAEDPLGGISTSIYDPNGNLTTFEDSTGGILEFTYDDQGRMLTSKDQEGNITEYVYGNLASPIEVISPDGVSTKTSYANSGQVASTTNGFGLTTTFTFTNAGLPESVIDTNGQSSYFEFDGSGRISKFTDAENNATEYEYDLNGNLIRELDPFGGVLEWEYDTQGRVTKTTDQNGLAIVSEYNSLGDITKETWLDSASIVVNTIEYEYDPDRNLTYVAGSDSAYQIQYDAVGRAIRIDNSGTNGVPTFVLDYEYDDNGNLVSVSDNFGAEVGSSFDSESRLTSRIWSLPSTDEARFDFTYDERSYVASIDRYSDVAGIDKVGSTISEFDDSGRISSIVHRDMIDSVLSQFAYQYNSINQIETETTLSDSTQYVYDLLGQLTDADHSVQADESYTYDDNGNRVSSALHGNSYSTGTNNQLLSDGEFNYTYDAVGNLIEKTELATGIVTKFTYNHKNNVVGIEEQSSDGTILKELSFSFDVFGRRISKSIDIDGAASLPVETEYFVYDGEHVWADIDETGIFTDRFLFSNAVDQVLARYRVGTGVNWHLSDRLGTVHDIVDNSGNIVNHVEYDSFGNIIMESNPENGDRYKFTGREYDSESETYYYRARNYDPSTGRFTSIDPVGFYAGDSNLYRYVSNSPGNGRDPSGQTVVVAYAGVICQTISRAFAFTDQISSATVPAFAATAFGLVGIPVDPAPILQNLGKGLDGALKAAFSFPAEFDLQSLSWQGVEKVLSLNPFLSSVISAKGQITAFLDYIEDPTDAKKKMKVFCNGLKLKPTSRPAKIYDLGAPHGGSPGKGFAGSGVGGWRIG